MIQGCTGIGFGLIAGPALVGVDADFVPGPMLIPTLLISGRHVAAEWAHLDRPGLRSLAMGAPFGLVAGLVVLTAVSDRALALLVGAMVMAAAILVLAGVGPQRSEPMLLGAGALATFTGVSAGLPGPPISIAYHDAPPSTLRATGSFFFSFFIVIATALLSAFGEYGVKELRLTLLLIPPILIGLFLARYLRPLVDATVFRPVVLVLAGLGGLALVLRSL